MIRLNDEQQQAVDTIDGPLLVLAGPGTGKTQLLSARVAYILRVTDTLAGSIVCLTFTEAAAQNMRERLLTMIGEAAYDVHINTYHGFASDIIRSHPDYFLNTSFASDSDSRLETPIDELTQIKIISTLLEKLPLDDSLRSARHYVQSVVSTIADLKQANITPSKLREIAEENREAIEDMSKSVNELFHSFTRMPSKLDKALPLFEDIRSIFKNASAELAQSASHSLKESIEKAIQQQSTKPLTVWKNNWLQKDETDAWVFGDKEQANRLLSLATLYQHYQDQLAAHGYYDFNDMILRTLQALNDSPDLRYNLQEKYQYMLLDEFQDTNAAQFELVRLLADHPVHEGRPNIMAVGDDDQGIYAFQGAEVSNMIHFIQSFRDVMVINLTKNYRSHHEILQVAHNIASQIESRLHTHIEGIEKSIVAASDKLPDQAIIERHDFRLQAAEYGWIAEAITGLIKGGTPAHEIAVLAPKHIILESLVSFLNHRNIPVYYEKRENIFDAEIIRALLLTAEFIVAASKQNFVRMDELLPRVFSLAYWQIPTKNLWELNWKHNKQKGATWVQLALETEAMGDETRFLLQLSSMSEVQDLEQLLDYITGAKPLVLADREYTSPLKAYYFSQESLQNSTLVFYEAISHLSVMRSKLREQQRRADDALHLQDLLALRDVYQVAERPLTNTHPIAQAESAVQLLTVYKAKGLEFDHVFLPNMHDDVWGSAARGAGNKLSLPQNLKYIRHESGGEDDARRLLFVAITRARSGLYMTSHELKESGKQTMPVKYLQEAGEREDRRALVLPENTQRVLRNERDPESLNSDIDLLWHSRHSTLTPTMKSLLKDRLARYVMSPTHLNSFTNIEYAGPNTFLLQTLLRFPEAPSFDGLYGNALHRSLEYFQKSCQSGDSPSLEAIITFCEQQLIQTISDKQVLEQLLKRAQKALRSYIPNNTKLLGAHAGIEVDFSSEGVVYKNARLTGKIDRLEIDTAKKIVRIVDFKSGHAADSLTKSTKLLGYKQQLYFYMLLVERSRTYKGYSIESARLEFIEPLSNGNPAKPLYLTFKDAEYEEFKNLVSAVWHHIQELDLPDISGYPASAAGMRAFIKFLTQK